MVAPQTQTMQRTLPIGTVPPGGKDPLWSATELTGVWICCCPGGCGITHTTADGDDVKVENGACCCMGLPCPICNERWVRKGDTNGFIKENGVQSLNNVDMHTSKSTICNEPGCAVKIC